MELPASVSFTKLWVYTNYDCNLTCDYCLAESSPRAPRRALGLETTFQLIDEAVELGFEEIFFTGGEPLVLTEIFPILHYSTQRVKTILLTNAMLVKGKRLEKLKAIQHPNLIIQVSLDGGQAEPHDAYRGQGSWVKTVAGLHRLRENDFPIRISTTETPANTEFLDEICAFHQSLGIAEGAHFIRPLARRGASQAGMELTRLNILPEVTVNVDGVYWHPLSTDRDMIVSREIFPLRNALNCLHRQLEMIANGEEPRIEFT